MVKFRLVVRGSDDENFYECFLVRDFNMPSLPRVGEYINLTGDDHKVESVFHNLDDGIVEVKISNFLLWQLCDAFLKYGHTWKLEGFLPELEEEFQECLKKRNFHHDKKKGAK